MSGYVFTVNDVGNQSCKVHCPLCGCEGGGKYHFPVAGQSKLEINGVPAVLQGQGTSTECCPYGCPASIVVAGSKVEVNGRPVALGGGEITGEHDQGKLTVTSHEKMWVL